MHHYQGFGVLRCRFSEAMPGGLYTPYVSFQKSSRIPIEVLRWVRLTLHLQ